MYYLKDHLGHIRVKVKCDPQRTVLAAQDYYPYGEILAQSMSISDQENKFLFQSKERDWETGLDYVEARYYDPAIGMFRQVDPLWEKYNYITPYSYVNNSPLIFIDQTGENWFYYQADGDSVASWHWHEGDEYTYTNSSGKKITLKSDYVYLVVYDIKGKNTEGAATGTVILYGNGYDDIILKIENVFSGGGPGNHDPIDPGNYIIRLDIRDEDGPSYIKSDGSNPEPFFGIQRIPTTGTIKYLDKNVPIEIVNMAYGAGRIRLIPIDNQKDRGLYFHGKYSNLNWTHGCVCDKSEKLFNYFWKSPYRGKVPFFVKTIK